MKNYMELFINGLKYIQRSPNSKILVYEKNCLTKKIEDIGKADNEILEEFVLQEQMKMNPTSFFNIEIINNEAKIIEYIGPNKIKNIIIPEIIDGFKVTSLSDNIFLQCMDIEKIELPNSVKKLPRRLCLGMSDIKEIIFSNDIDKIPDDCFNGCLSLQYINTANIKSIGESAFRLCSTLNNISLNNVKQIEQCAFMSCTHLTEIDISNAISIGNNAFDGCYYLKSVKLSEELECIEMKTFNRCTYLQNINFPTKCTQIKRAAFDHCNNLQNIDFPDGLLCIEDQAFCNCGELTKVFFPNSLKKIGEYAFANCKKLEEISVFNKTEIDPDAFDYTSLLKIKQRTILSNMIDKIKER